MAGGGSACSLTTVQWGTTALIKVKSKSTLSHSVENSLIFLCRPLGSIHVLEDATGEGVRS